MKIKLFVVLAIVALAFAQDDDGFFDDEPDKPEENPWVTEHNKIRKEVDVPPLMWSSELAESASRHAKRLAKTCDDLYNSDDNTRGKKGVLKGSIGENIAARSSTGEDSYVRRNKEERWLRAGLVL